MRHRAIDIGRRHATHEARRANDATLEHHRSREDVAADAVDRLEARDLKALLRELPDAQREVIVLAFYGELTHTEIADELGLPMGTVKGRMRGGLHGLRLAIKPIAA